MRIRLLLFGLLSEISNKSELEINDASNTEELKNKVYDLYPDLREITFSIAVNKEMVKDNFNLKEGDEVAFLPPFAGG